MTKVGLALISIAAVLVWVVPTVSIMAYDQLHPVVIGGLWLTLALCIIAGQICIYLNGHRRQTEEERLIKSIAQALKPPYQELQTYIKLVAIGYVVAVVVFAGSVLLFRK